MICQIFFILWGCVVAFSVIWLTCNLWNLTAADSRHHLERLFACTLGGAAFGIVLMVGSLYALFYTPVDGDGYGESGYYTFMVAMRVTEFMMTFLLWFMIVPAHLFNRGKKNVVVVSRKMSSSKIYVDAARVPVRKMSQLAVQFTKSTTES
jgi:hypothetical protein